MDTLKSWTARRSGGRITINGIDVETGMPMKVPNIDTIVASAGSKSAVATDKNGEQFELVI